MSLLQRKHEEYYFTPLAYHDSWLSIDPIIGCTLNCKYCFMQMAGWTASRPERILTVEEVVRELLTHPRFVPHETMLSFGNQTDPFLPENWEYLSSLLKRLESLELTNPLAFVTKKRIPDFLIREFLATTFIKPLFFLSYSGLSKTIEKGVNPEENEANFRALAQEGLRVIHFWRPLTEANGDDGTLTRVLHLVAQYARASVYVGLKLNPSLVVHYRAAVELHVPPGMQANFGDYLPEAVERRLRRLASALYPEYPLYLHTSCAASLALSIPDYNATVYNDRVCKGSNCPRAQRDTCERHRKLPSEVDVSEALLRIGCEAPFWIDENALFIQGTLTQQDHSWLTHRLRFPVHADRLVHDRILRGSVIRHSGDLRAKS